MYPGAVPRPRDVVKCTGSLHHNDFCIVRDVSGGIVHAFHENDTAYDLPLSDVVVVFRPGWRDHVV